MPRAAAVVLQFCAQASGVAALGYAAVLLQKPPDVTRAMAGAGDGPCMAATCTTLTTAHQNDILTNTDVCQTVAEGYNLQPHKWEMAWGSDTGPHTTLGGAQLTMSSQLVLGEVSGR